MAGALNQPHRAGDGRDAGEDVADREGKERDEVSSDRGCEADPEDGAPRPLAHQEGTGAAQ